MRILGIGDHVSCGSAVVEDGKVVASIIDERLIREKMAFGVPRASITENMRILGLKPGDIDAIAVATKNQHIIDGYVDFKDGWFGLQRSRYKQILFDVASDVSRFRKAIPGLDNVYYAMRAPAYRKRRKRLGEILRNEFGFECPVHFIDHHYAHVATAYYGSGHRTATAFSIDGGGDANSASVYDVVDGKFTMLKEVSSFDSVGCFYSYVTQLCGYKGGKHEGKITGLAAYGEPKYIPQLREILIFEDGGFKNVGNVFFTSALKKMKELLPPDFLHKDLAASIQVYCEELVVNFVRYWLQRTKHYNVVLSGGVMANVKINQRVHQIPEAETTYVYPGMSDEGMPNGAALALYHELCGKPYDPEKTVCHHDVYLGPEYSDEEIKEELDKRKVEATRYDNVEAEIAKLLAEGAVVARFNGRMEYGPRALGNRTILYRPDDPSVHYWLNDALSRTEFMPFAPVVLRDQAERCFVDLKGAEDTARFMTITMDCTDYMNDLGPGVVHIDRTARPQLVDESDNPSMYKVLVEYQKLTGHPCLINTSFNMHEEPIVCSPYDAIRAFKLGHLDYLAIGNYIAKNPHPVDRNVDSTKYDSALSRTGAMV